MALGGSCPVWIVTATLMAAGSALGQAFDILEPPPGAPPLSASGSFAHAGSAGLMPQTGGAFLLRMPEVQSALRLTAEQNAKLAQHLHRQRDEQRRRLQELGRLAPEERGKRLAAWQGEEEKQLQAILTPEQQKRFRQLLLQQQGLPALMDPAVVAELKLTGDQQNAIRSALQERDQGMRTLFAPGPGGFDIEGMGRKIEALRRQADEKVMGVLTAEQKQQWRAMLGAPFSFSSAGRVVLGAPGQGAPEEAPLPADVPAGLEPASP